MATNIVELAAKYSDVVIFPKFGITAYMAASVPLAMTFFYAGWQYSNFTNKSKEDKINDPATNASETTLKYAPSLILSVCALNYFQSNNPNIDTSTRQYLHLISPCLMLITHFGKKLLETQFVHISSNNTNNSSMMLQVG